MWALNGAILFIKNKTIYETTKAKIATTITPFNWPKKVISSPFEAKIPTANVPQIPFNKWTDNAPTGSSSFNLSKNDTPNTTKEALLSYKKRIKEACIEDKFEPYVTLFFQNDYSYSFLEDIKDDIIAIKLYPAGITTNSETGVSSMDVEVLRPTLESMSK